MPAHRPAERRESIAHRACACSDKVPGRSHVAEACNHCSGQPHPGSMRKGSTLGSALVGRAVNHEREAAAEAVVLDVQSYVMVDVRVATAVDLGADLVDVATVAAAFPPGLPGCKAWSHQWCVFDADYTAPPEAFADLSEGADCPGVAVFHVLLFHRQHVCISQADVPDDRRVRLPLLTACRFESQD